MDENLFGSYKGIDVKVIVRYLYYSAESLVFMVWLLEPSLLILCEMHVLTIHICILCVCVGMGTLRIMDKLYGWEELYKKLNRRSTLASLKPISYHQINYDEFARCHICEA